MPKPITLANYLTAFALILTAPLLIGAVYSVNEYATNERSRLENLADRTNREIVALIDRELSNVAAILYALSTSSSLHEGDIDKFDQQARALVVKTGSHFVLHDTTGQQIINTIMPPGSRLPMTTDPDLVPEINRTKGVYVSNLFTDPVTQDFRIQVAVPVTRGDDVTAILGSTIQPQRLVNLLREGLPEGPFNATILDRDGVVVARSTPSRGFVGNRFSRLAQSAQGDKGVVSIVNSNKIPIFGYYRRPEMSGWVIAAAVDHAALTAPLTRNLQVLFLAAIALALLVAGGAWWVAHNLWRAHSELVAAAIRVGNGHVIVAPTTRLYEANLVGDALAAASRSIGSHANALRRVNLDLEKRVESRTQELAAKTALLETTLDTMKQGLIVFDGNGRIPICNPCARKMLDLPDELVNGTPTFDELFTFLQRRGEFDDLPPEQIQTLRPGSGSDFTLYERQRPDGTIMEVQTVPIRGDGGFVRTYTDVTAQHRHAHELEEARDAAERANSAKGDFIATMSHEMRTPLNAVIGYSELLLHNAELADTGRRGVEHILSAGSALLCLVDDILDIGKIEAGILDVRAEPFSLQEVVDDAVSIVRPAALDKKIELSVSPAASMGGVFVGDRDRLRQVLLNLLNNAVKFTPAGSIELSIDESAASDERRLLRFAITDSGIGISQTAQGELFQRFHQVDGSIDRRFGGAGLGLAISKELVERMGGSIGVTSDLGSGSTFWFELPLAPTTAVKGVAAFDIIPRRRGARILVAEDVVSNQDLARELIEAAGHNVDIVSNGVDALEAVKSGSYDLVLMDVYMPGMDGLTATKLIRKAAYVADTPVVACTAHVFPSQVSALRDAGVDAYLRKPLRRTELYATIDRFLENREHEPRSESLPIFVEAEPEPVWDIISLLGPKRAVSALNLLTDELQALSLACDPSNVVERERLAEQAHAVISTASILNLTELAERCRDLENACRDAMDEGSALEKLKLSIKDALATSDRLKTELMSSSI